MSSKDSSKDEKMKLAPLRSMNDFLLDTQRYSMPAFNDLKRFNNRVTSNLLYYQTNYMIFSGAFYLLFLLFRMKTILAGVIGVAVHAALILYSLGKIPQANSLLAQYPASKFGALGFNVVALFWTFRPVLFLVYVLPWPILFAIAHAAVKSRGIKNKVSNKMEQLGAPVYTSTPMGIVLVTLGLEAKDFDC